MTTKQSAWLSAGTMWFAALLAAQPAYAVDIPITVDLNGVTVRAHNYIGAGVVIFKNKNNPTTDYWPGTSCPSVVVSNARSESERSRFWNLIQTAKALNKPIVVFIPTTTDCNVNSFGIDGG